MAKLILLLLAVWCAGCAAREKRVCVMLGTVVEECVVPTDHPEPHLVDPHPEIGR